MDFPIDLPRSRSDLEALRRSRGHVEKELAAEATFGTRKRSDG